MYPALFLFTAEDDEILHFASNPALPLADLADLAEWSSTDKKAVLVRNIISKNCLLFTQKSFLIMFSTNRELER